MEKSKHLDIDWLKQKYEVEMLTTTEIGEMCGRDPGTISHRLRKIGIKTRGTKSPTAKYHDLDWLRSEYEGGRFVQDIADEFGVSKGVISYWMKKANITGRHQESRIIDGMKICTDCGENLPISAYWKKKASTDGYYQHCKSCAELRRGDASIKYRASENCRSVSRKKMRRHRATTAGHIHSVIGSAVYKSLRGRKNGYSWESLVGFTQEELRAHIESQFEPWMTWDNWGVAVTDKENHTWHIDHIIPVSAFSITSYDCDGFKACWALSNLRPMCAIENIRKGGE